MSAPKTITVFTHAYPDDTGDAVRRLIDFTLDAGITVRVPPEEARKHGLSARDGVELDADPDGDTEMAVVLGGDGTILTTLRAFAGRSAPVFAFNYGAIGFLSTVDHDCLDEGLRRLASGDYELVSMPALTIETADGPRLGVNDISFHRRPEGRVAILEYSVAGQQLGRVRCDGLVAGTPAGSTAYNLANGGPVVMWGIDAMTITFIAPHSLNARPLVVPRGLGVTIRNRTPDLPVTILADGHAIAELPPDGLLRVGLGDEHARLALLPEVTFFRRYHDVFPT